MPGGRAVSSRLSRSLTPLASRRSWTRSRTPQSTSPRSRKTWTSCTTRWTWRTPATAALTWRTTTASSAPPSRSSGGCGQHPGRGHGHLPSEPAVGRREPRGGPLGGCRGQKARQCAGQQAVSGVGPGEGVDRRHRPRGGPGSAGLQGWGVAKGESSLESAGVSPAGGRVREGGAGGVWTREGPVGAPGLSIPRGARGHWRR